MKNINSNSSEQANLSIGIIVIPIVSTEKKTRGILRKINGISKTINNKYILSSYL